MASLPPSLPLAGSMAHLDICLVYYVNKSRLACYDPPGSCFCCVAEMCGAQLGCLAGRVNPLRQISCVFPQPYGVGTFFGGGGFQAGIKRSILIHCYQADLSDVIKAPSFTLGAYSVPPTP